jgi:putative addiction module component (TIGR02574 family)
MSQQTSQLLDAALKLPPGERGELITRLIDSLESQEDHDEQEWSSELARRIEEARNGSVQMVPWDKARKMIMSDSDEQ